jgi:hypothetical protein
MEGNQARQEKDMHRERVAGHVVCRRQLRIDKSRMDQRVSLCRTVGNMNGRSKTAVTYQKPPENVSAG